MIKPQLSFEITTAFKLAYRPEPKLYLGCPVLNDFFRGGLLPKRLYEIYGESGTGKTQFAIQLLLNAILPEKHGGLDGNALFVMAGKFLNEKRFSEIKDNFLAETTKQAQTQQQAPPITDANIRDCISLVHA
jgi:RecA/RadA recombinase